MSISSTTIDLIANVVQAIVFAATGRRMSKAEARRWATDMLADPPEDLDLPNRSELEDLRNDGREE